MCLDILLAILLFIMIYQDFKSKAIDWYLFILLPLFIILNEITNLLSVFYNFLINAGFLLGNFLILIAFFSIKHRQFINPLKNYMGMGDLLFFIGLAFLFSPLNYLLFFTGSLLLTLIAFFLIFKFTPSTTPEIPLAGFVSIIVLVLLVYRSTFHICFQDDTWIYQYLLLNGVY
jgi:hypothetical protein